MVYPLVLLINLAVALAAVPLEFTIKRGNSIHEINSQKSVSKAYFEALEKRDSLEIKLRNDHTFYVSELDIAGQKIGVMVDTGSADLWVPSDNVKCLGVDEKPASTCTGYGSFATGKSESWNQNTTAPSFSISYTDGTEAHGVWGHDDINLDGTQVKSLSFAVVNQTSSNIGVLGIGLPKLELTNSQKSPGHSPYTYENLPSKMRNHGLIERTVFSVYMDKSDADHGTILFGGVDSSKFDGKLTRVPILNTRRDLFDEPAMVHIIVDGVGITQGDDDIEVSSNKYYALLDTGSTSSYFPKPLFNKFVETLDAKTTNMGAQVNCDFLKSDATVKLDFSGSSISFPLSELLISYQDQCYLGVFPQDSTYLTLGDNMLRYAYWVYDYDNYEVAFAQANFKGGDSNVDEVTSPQLPGAVSAPGYSNTELPKSVSESDVTTTLSPVQNEGRTKSSSRESSHESSQESSAQTEASTEKSKELSSSTNASSKLESSEASSGIHSSETSKSSSEVNNDSSNVSSTTNSSEASSDTVVNESTTSKSPSNSFDNEVRSTDITTSSAQSASSSSSESSSSQKGIAAVLGASPFAILLGLLI